MTNAQTKLDKNIQKLEEDFMKQLQKSRETKILEAKVQIQENIIKSKDKKIEELKILTKDLRILVEDLQQQQIESKGKQFFYTSRASIYVTC